MSTHPILSDPVPDTSSSHEEALLAHAALHHQNEIRLGFGSYEWDLATDRGYWSDGLHYLHGRAQYDGSGIGLAICKKIVEHHHGFITAEGRPEAGATIIIILPETAEA